VSAIEASKDYAGQSDVPDWVFPLNAAAASNPPPYDNVRPLHVPNSKVAFTEAELNDLFNVPDWHPTSHSAMPAVVAHGHPSDVYACGYCHTAGGQGRPENASLREDHVTLTRTFRPLCALQSQYLTACFWPARNLRLVV
jgi:hypothetical protein